MIERTLVIILTIAVLVNVMFGVWLLRKVVSKDSIVKWLGLIVLAIFTLSTGLVIISSLHLIKKDIEKKEVIQLTEALLFKDSVKLYIEELNIKHPDIVLNQAVIESGNFSSKVFKENNNMFGFKQAYKRPNTQIGVNRGYAVYKDWQECVIDYALYQTYSAKNLSKEDYINFLGRHYAEDPNYTDKIK